MPIDHDRLVAFLQIGATADELEAYVKEHEPEIATNADKVYLARINWVGSLRNEGYVIPRKRGHYKIEGFEPKGELAPAEDWPEEQQDILRSFEALEEVGAKEYRRIADRCKYVLGEAYDKDVPVPHQISPGYTLSYELANDEGRWSGTGAIIVRKFKNQPRFRIILPSIQTLGLDDVVRVLGQASRKNVKLMSVMTGENWKQFGFERDTQRLQGFYNLESMVKPSFLDSLHSRKAAYVKRNLRELKMVKATEMQAVDFLKDGKHVIETWRAGAAGQKQRQLAITRDFVALELAPIFIRNTSYIFYRDSRPVGLIIYDPINRFTVGDLVCKGLNYPAMPGGYHNTAFTMVMMVASDLLAQGFRHINDGGLDGGTEGLYNYKRGIIDSVEGSTLLKTQDWYMPNTSYTPGPYVKKT